MATAASDLEGAEERAARAYARKRSGSYYTPDSLVQALLDSALEPVLEAALAKTKNPRHPEEALLGLRVIDPSCGTGHFVLAAGKRLASRLAQLRATSTPPSQEYARAFQDVVEHCLFGVDLNPAALESCRRSLWMEAGCPAVFSAPFVRLGNALIGQGPSREPVQSPMSVEEADAWCATLLCPPSKHQNLDPNRVGDLKQRTKFFHWPLEFPQVFARGGFDVVLGNPPWERAKLQEKEFFAGCHPELAQAQTAAQRKKWMMSLAQEKPGLWDAWNQACQKTKQETAFYKRSGRFPHCARGDVNLYALFAELIRSLLGPSGRAGFVVPAGLAMEDSTKAFFEILLQHGELLSFYGFENARGLFEDVHRSYLFALMTLGGERSSKAADFVFFLHQVPELACSERHLFISPEDIALFNPNTRTCPMFRSRRDAEINQALYLRAGILWRDGHVQGNPWGLSMLRMFDLTHDSALFHGEPGGGEDYLPLIEAKMVHLFDHRFGSYEGQTQAQANQGKLPELSEAEHQDPIQKISPRWWVKAGEVERRLRGRWNREWFLGFRDICRSTDRRTVVACIVPKAAVGNSFPLLMPSAANVIEIASLYANLCSFVLDYAARQKVCGTHLNYVQLKQLPVLAPDIYRQVCPWDSSLRSLGDWIAERVLELCYTAWDMKAFAGDLGYRGPPFRWDAGRRFELRAELDAAFLYLYRVPPGDAGHLLDSFQAVRKSDMKRYGEYRTKRAVLERYARFAAAVG